MGHRGGDCVPHAPCHLASYVDLGGLSTGLPAANRCGLRAFWRGDV